MSALNNHTDVVQLLIDSDADIATADDGGNTPLHYAAFRYYIVMMMMMMMPA